MPHSLLRQDPFPPSPPSPSPDLSLLPRCFPKASNPGLSVRRRNSSAAFRTVVTILKLLPSVHPLSVTDLVHRAPFVLRPSFRHLPRHRRMCLPRCDLILSVRSSPPPAGKVWPHVYLPAFPPPTSSRPLFASTLIRSYSRPVMAVSLNHPFPHN